MPREGFRIVLNPYELVAPRRLGRTDNGIPVRPYAPTTCDEIYVAKLVVPVGPAPPDGGVEEVAGIPFAPSSAGYRTITPKTSRPKRSAMDTMMNEQTELSAPGLPGDGTFSGRPPCGPELAPVRIRKPRHGPGKLRRPCVVG
jgi:hypothetical protein